jgi:hypothetical protein
MFFSNMLLNVRPSTEGDGVYSLKIGSVTYFIYFIESLLLKSKTFYSSSLRAQYSNSKIKAKLKN